MATNIEIETIRGFVLILENTQTKERHFAFIQGVFPIADEAFRKLKEYNETWEGKIPFKAVGIQGVEMKPLGEPIIR